jgi:hypothetical protein
VAHILSGLDQVPLEQLNRALAQFPGLAEKLQEYGGIRGYRQAVRQEGARRRDPIRLASQPVPFESL